MGGNGLVVDAPSAAAPGSIDPETLATLRELHENREIDRIITELAEFAVAIDDWALVQEEAVTGERLPTRYGWLVANSKKAEEGSEGELVEAPKDVKLPESIEESKPRETVVISVSPEHVLVQGKAVALVEDILGGELETLDPLAARLAELKENIVGPATMSVAESQEVTILADKSVPFIVVRRIMSACTGEGYENVSLAVIQKPTQMAAN